MECVKQAVLIGEKSEDPFLEDLIQHESQPLARGLDLLT